MLFLQSILEKQSHPPAINEIYFADGNDPQADLQVLQPKASEHSAAYSLLASLHRQSERRTDYRSHVIPSVTGPSDPDQIRKSFSRLRDQVGTGDRVLIYVTAHGGVADREQESRFNTSIYCWDDRHITVAEFVELLNQLPNEVPILMVMTQCYCGGFGHAIFEKLEESPRLATQLRAGFFAQRHDLPAAGCRPDIENDEEFSSYFWGAFIGQSRTGEAMAPSDLDGNGSVSFDEAYARAVIASQTIDIPLRASDVLLRTYSKLRDPHEDEDKVKRVNDADIDVDAEVEPQVGTEITQKVGEDVAPKSRLSMLDTLGEVARHGDVVTREIVLALGKQLEFEPNDSITSIKQAYAEHRQTNRRNSRGSRPRGRSGRRALLEEIREQWPELADRRSWSQSRLLQGEQCQKLWTELQQLPGFAAYEQRRQEREAQSDRSEKHELREVTFRRLISHLDGIVLAHHLPQVASPEVVMRYHQMRALEGSLFTP